MEQEREGGREPLTSSESLLCSQPYVGPLTRLPLHLTTCWSTRFRGLTHPSGSLGCSKMVDVWTSDCKLLLLSEACGISPPPLFSPFLLHKGSNPGPLCLPRRHFYHWATSADSVFLLPNFCFISYPVLSLSSFYLAFGPLPCPPCHMLNKSLLTEYWNQVKEKSETRKMNAVAYAGRDCIG